MNMAIKTVLVVDDDPAVVLALRKRLLDAGFDVQTACNGKEALHLARDTTVDAITLDVGLAGDLDGLDVARELSSDPHTAQIPVIFITGTTDPEFKDKCESVGGRYFLAKPYDADVLVRILEGVFGDDALSQVREISCAKRRQPVV